MLIQFQFDPEKAVEAAALLLKLHGKPMKYLGLLKMLYISDRIALEHMEQPITGDNYVSMDYGPVLSDVYDLIKGRSDQQFQSIWYRFISPRNGNYVSLIGDPGQDELCEEESDIICSVYECFGHLDPFKVADWTHDLPEWRNPHGSSIPISVEDVLKGLGKSNSEIAEIRQEAERETYLYHALNG